MKLRLVLLAAIAAVTFARPGNKPELIKLADGQKIFGVIIENECRNEHLVVRVIRRNQKLTVAWEKVAPADAHKLRVRLGFEVEDAHGTLKIIGHWIKNRSGVTFTGLLLNEKSAERDGFFRLKTAGRELKIFLKDVREGPEAVEVDALV
ncbi:MAG: hypothetical protein O7E54_05915, partial [Planctomycetota bacterium]|nr:hypothetical protein [Planctomycetota bacterium]